MKGRSVLALAVLSLALACEGNKLPTGLSVPMDPSKVISDGTRDGGNPDFFFLPPMVPNPVHHPNFEPGKFNNALQPSLTVEICELESDVNGGLPTEDASCVQTEDGKPLKKFAAGTVRQVGLPRNQSGWWSAQDLPDEGFYYVLWDTRESSLDLTKYYRIKVFVEGATVPFGFADVDPMSNMREWHNVRTGDVIPLIDDRTLPIAFRVEKGALCAGGTCNSATITSTSATGSQSVEFDAGGGSIAGASFPNGWLPSPDQCAPNSPCPQSVVVTVTEVNTAGSGLPGEQTICHPRLDPRLQQFRGCFHYTTTPELRPFNGVDQFAQPVTVAVCYELQGSGDPREKFAELYTSGPNEEPHALEDVSDGGLLGVATKDCSNPTVAALESSNPFARLASEGWRKLKGGLDGVFGVKTAYAVDQGLGGIVKGFSNISPVLPATIQSFSFESVTLDAGQFTTISKVKIVGNHSHIGDGAFTGIDGVPVTFSVTANSGTLKPANSDTPPSTGPVTETTTTQPGTQPIDGIAAVEWTVPTAPGTYTMTATGAATGGPITFTAIVPLPLANPVLSFAGSEVYNVTAGNFVRYNLPVTNYAVYPAALFAPAADLPACGSNTNASRTWVDFYDATTNARIYGFCGLEAPSDLQNIWFAEPVGTAPPSQVYIKLTDRATGVTYTSNSVSLTSPNPVLCFGGTEFYTAGNTNLVRYKLPVSNYSAYRPEMFASAPLLPACGSSAGASRTWVDIYDATNDVRLYGFCGLGAPSDLQNIWFAEPVGTAPPSQVYIKLTDRATGVVYTSNNVAPIQPVVLTGVIDFETYPTGAGVCDGATGCALTDQFSTQGVTFTSNTSITPTPTPYLCKTVHGPVGSVENYGVVGDARSGCDAWLAGVVTMHFASLPTTVEFELDGSTVQTTVFPVTALDASGASPTVTVSSVFTYMDATGHSMRHEARRVTSPNGIASVGVDSRVLGYTIDNLLITQ